MIGLFKTLLISNFIKIDWKYQKYDTQSQASFN